jgi:hypothetical protein
VSRFLNDARRILEAAETAEEPDIAILIHRRQGIQLVCGKGDWSLPSLLSESGAAAAYRVSRRDGQLQVEGTSETETCVLQKKTGKRVLRELLEERRAYEVVGPDQWGSAARILLT